MGGFFFCGVGGAGGGGGTHRYLPFFACRRVVVYLYMRPEIYALWLAPAPLLRPGTGDSSHSL